MVVGLSVFLTSRNDMEYIKYKDDLPEKTVRRIKGLLAGLNIHTNEQYYNYEDMSYSCRISINSSNLGSLNIGTNGKGMDASYSLASGYGELMERLQNKMLLFEAIKYSSRNYINSKDKKLPFRLFPDEKDQLYQPNTFIDLINCYFPNYKIDRVKNRINGNIHCLTVPFVDVFNKEQIQLPIEIVRANSSTGMCSGNTPSEAIVQGINEIFERYVLQRMYVDKITPPSFPKEYFKGSEIYRRLEKLKEDGFLYDIKDCSLGKGFPVVGLLLTNTKNGTWTFRLGSDLSSLIALERCLTEIFQGRKVNECHFNLISLGKEISIRDEYEKSLRDGTGLFPDKLLGDTPDYDFGSSSFSRTGNSMDDLKQITGYLLSKDYRLLVRDNSFLGFPTYQLIIPGLSDQCYEVNDIIEDYIWYQEHLNEVWPLYRLKELTSNETIGAYSIIQKKYSDRPFVKLFPYCDSLRANVQKNLLLFLLSVKMNNYEKAFENICRYMEFRSANRFKYDEYLSCVKDYIYLKKERKSLFQIKTVLTKFYSTKVIDEVVSDFADSWNIMKNYSFPSCFNCRTCSLKSKCLYSDVIDFEFNIQMLQLSNPIDQDVVLRNFK